MDFRKKNKFKNHFSHENRSTLQKSKREDTCYSPLDTNYSCSNRREISTNSILRDVINLQVVLVLSLRASRSCLATYITILWKCNLSYSKSKQKSSHLHFCNDKVKYCKRRPKNKFTFIEMEYDGPKRNIYMF